MRKFFRVIAKSKTDKEIKKFLKKRQKTRESWSSFADKYGANQTYQGDSLLGLLFEGNAPDGWISTGNLPSTVFKPGKRKSCMDAYNEFKKLKRLRGAHFLSVALDTGSPCDGRKMYFPTFEMIGDTLVLDLHNKHRVPNDVEPLKTSEYWALKEQVEEV